MNLADAWPPGVATGCFDDVNATYALTPGARCATSDKSQLSSVARGVLPDPDAHVIPDVTLSNRSGRPSGTATTNGSTSFNDGFRHHAAEEYGITSENVGNGRPSIIRSPPVAGVRDALLGLSNDFAVNVISAVGNYGEIYI